MQHWWKKCIDRKGDYIKKINLIRSHFIRASWSTYELFRQPSYIVTVGTSGCVMVNKLDWQTYMSVFVSH